MRRVLLLIAFLQLICFSGISQSIHGKVTYAVRYDDTDLSDEDLSMLPSEAVIVFKGDRMRMDMSMGLGMSSAVIVQRDQVYTLMDVLGDKFAIRTNREEIRKDSKDPDAYRLKQLTGDFKDIAGHRCRKAVLECKGQEDMTVWYTDRMKSSATWYYQMDGIEGFPMEFDLKAAGMSVRMAAVSVQDSEPSDGVFNVGTEYRIMKQEEVAKMLGAGR